MERDEVHGFCGQFDGWKTATPEWLKDGKLAHLVQFASKRSADMPDTPLLSEFARDDEERQMLAFVQTSIEDRALVMAPGVPADRVEAMERAYAALLKDPEFVADANKQKFEIDPVTSTELRQFIKGMLLLKPDQIKRLRKAQGLE
jgi:tripartite-type tricarboxylate transporter receptor subunit TctC